MGYNSGMKQSSGAETLPPESMDINKTIEQIEQALKDDKGASPALIAAVHMMIMLVKLLTDRLGLNSRNSSKPPSDDSNNGDETKKPKGNKPPGGQVGHKGSTLGLVDNPDKIIPIPISIDTGSLFNFNKLAYHRLAQFEQVAKQQLFQSHLIHADETSINVNGGRIWLHNASNNDWTLIAPHQKRGKEAMDEIDILPHFTGVLCHDHWKPYYRYDAMSHSLCNAHHLRELIRAHEQDQQSWAKEMHTLLTELNIAVDENGGQLSVNEIARWQMKYRQLLDKADIECPPPPERTTEDGVKKRGRVARSKARNLLERLRDFEDDVLRFMQEKQVPFTNNQGERDIRMTKVQQKISGCFRSTEGAKIFCRIRSYLSTCQKNEVGIGPALECLMSGEPLPDFIQKEIDKLQAAE